MHTMCHSGFALIVPQKSLIRFGARTIRMNHSFKAFEDAGAALMRGDHAKASRLLRPLAEQGNTDAQVRLTLIDVGTAYKKGDYVTQHD
jgi:TPR repeat protein